MATDPPFRRIRHRANHRSCPQSPFLRQWGLLEYISSQPEGVSVEEAADATGMSTKTIRRDLDVFHLMGFDLEATTEDYGRKRWCVRSAFQRLRSKQQKYQTLRAGLDILLNQTDQLEDRRLVEDLQAVRRRLARKCK